MCRISAVRYLADTKYATVIETLLEPRPRTGGQGVSAHPRILLADIYLTWDMGVVVLVRRGTMVGAALGSALEAADGGSGAFRP